MKKTISLLVILITALALVACNGESEEEILSDFPSFNEDRLVQMSPQQIVTMLESVNYEELMADTLRFHIEGTMEMRQSTSYDDFYYDWETGDYVDYVYSETNNVSLTLDVTYYMQMTEMVEDASLIFTGNIDMESSNSSNWSDELESYEVSAVGSLSAYLVNQYLYANPNLTVTEDDETETINFKQKLNEMLTQEMYDELLDGVLEQLSMFTGEDIEEIPEFIDTEEADELIEAIPNLKVYQDGNVTTIVFEINKQDIIDNAVTMLLAAAEVFGEVPPSQSEIDEMEEMIEDAVNEAVESLNFKYSISIVGDKVTSVAIEIQALIDSEELYLEIDMLVIIQMGITLPAIPEDLDTYTPVDDFDDFNGQ